LESGAIKANAQKDLNQTKKEATKRPPLLLWISTKAYWLFDFFLEARAMTPPITAAAARTRTIVLTPAIWLSLPSFADTERSESLLAEVEFDTAA
jgi:hypothetical protein